MNIKVPWFYRYARYMVWFISYGASNTGKLLLFVREHQMQCNAQNFIVMSTGFVIHKRQTWIKNRWSLKCYKEEIRRSQFPSVSVRSKSKLYQLVKKFQTTVFLLKKKKERTLRVLSEGTLESKFTEIPRKGCTKLIFTHSHKISCFKTVRMYGCAKTSRGRMCCEGTVL